MKFLVNNATTSQRRHEDSRLLILEKGKLTHVKFRDLSGAFSPGDVLVVNDAATIPASFHGSFLGGELEIRLAQLLNESFQNPFLWKAVVLGAGDWRTPTEKRPRPSKLNVGDTLKFKSGLGAKVLRVHEEISSRLVDMEFDAQGAELWRKIYEAGRPVQYSYLKESLSLWDQQTIFSGPPVAVEPPSASFPLTWSLLEKLRLKGVEVLSVTHGTGLSNTGDKAIDRVLPFPERSWISAGVKEKILRAQSQGRRVIALGTGVVRALESWGGRPEVPESFVTSLKIDPGFPLKVVSGLLTGFHEPEGSHLRLIKALVPEDLLTRAYAEASQQNYLWHEYGDGCLVLAG